MKKQITFLLVLTCLFSCRREQVYFQKSQPIVYESSPKKIIVQKEVLKENITTSAKEEMPIASEVFSQNADNQVEEVNFDLPFKEDIIKRKGKFLRKIFKAERGFTDKIESIGSKKASKSEKRKGSFLDDINSKIKIGVVFLLLAIILGLVGLKWIAVIFAIAAVLYLAWGLKRAFR